MFFRSPPGSKRPHFRLHAGLSPTAGTELALRERIVWRGEGFPLGFPTLLVSTYLWKSTKYRLRKERYALANRGSKTLDRLDLSRCWNKLNPLFTNLSFLVPLEGLQVDNKLYFVEEPVEIMDREVKQLRQSRVPIVKVRWNSRWGPEFTWEREDQFRKKYPHRFTKTAPSSSAVS
ncbi:hypothetical protein Tco_0981328 [Tanacetum coccineum]